LITSLASVVVAAAGVASGVALHFHNLRKKELEEKLKPVDQIRQYALELQLKYGSSPSTAPSDAELQATAREIYPKLSEALSLAVLIMSGHYEVYNPSKEFVRMVDEFARTRSPERKAILRKEIFDEANSLQKKIAVFSSAYKKEFTIPKILARKLCRNKMRAS